ncbi:tetratricopeptide repeat protein [Microbulbifer sp. SA54]|uniref:tetratricopeptide repeat protein n=1 Tax=Microbulbifer sp. SA54 TaxID=3401577 RepID=UPI003AADDFCA
MLLRIIFALIVACTCGCATHSQVSPSSHMSGQASETLIDAEYLLSGTALFGSAVTDNVVEPGLLEVSAEMASFIEELAPGEPVEQRWQALVAHFNQGSFAIEYSAQTTLSAAETFRNRSGNCLAVTLLLVALSRELGIEAHFNQVETPQLRKFEDQHTYVNYRHINMVAYPPSGKKVVDFGLIDYQPTMYQEEISDRVAFSQYYSNRAVEVMREAGDPLYAFTLLKKAISLSPGDSNFWLNLGAIYKRHGHFQEAAGAFQIALQLDPKSYIAMSNMERLYRESGNAQQALKFLEAKQELLALNPHNQYYISKSLFMNGEYRAAKARLQQALKENADDHRLHFLMGKTQYLLGDLKAATSHLTKAFSLLESREIELAYEAELSELKSTKRL